jgi:multimeric flavodoxin WrbA
VGLIVGEKMNISVILGSPRLASNSEKLAKSAVAAVSGPTDSVEYFRLNDLRYRGCQGCLSCKLKTEFCIIKDDLTRVLSSSAMADLVIITSPIYIGEITGQLKGFIDRTYSWYKPDFIENAEPSRLKPGKKLIFIISQGNPDKESYRKNIDSYLGYFASHGFKLASFIAPVGIDDVSATHPDLLKEISSLAQTL